MAFKLEDFYGLEAAVSNRLALETDTPVVAIARAVYNKDYDTARGLVESVSLDAFSLRDFIRTVFKLSFNYGTNLVDTNQSSKHDDTLLNLVVDNFCSHLNHSTLLSIHQAYYEVIAKIESLREVEKSAAKTIASKDKERDFIEDFVSFADPVQSKVKMVSSLHSSRLATWGFTSEAKFYGMSEYQLAAFLDNRTSAYCEMINGTRFKVRDAEETVVTVLSANPDDLKTVQPFPPQTKSGLEMLSKMSASELTANNWHIPPFHPWCRTMCVLVNYIRPNTVNSKPVGNSKIIRDILSEQEDLVKANTDILMNESTPTKDDLKKVKLDLTDKQLEAYNSIFQTKPSTTLGAIAGVGSDYLVLQNLSSFSTKVTEVDDGLSIKTRKTFPSYQRAGKSVRPYHDTLVTIANGILQVNELKLSNIKSPADFFKSYVGNLVKVAMANNLKKVAYEFTGEYSYALARLGFIFTTDIEGLREYILKRLDALQSIAPASLTATDYDMITRAVQSSALGKEGVRFIAEYPARVGGETLGKFLLKGYTGTATLDLSDTRTVEALTKATEL